MGTRTSRYSSLSLLKSEFCFILDLKNPSKAALALYNDIGEGKNYPMYSVNNSSMLAGDPAMKFCASHKLQEIPIEQFKHYHGEKEDEKFDTVGCICFDSNHGAVCTSSGGPKRKPCGRIGSVVLINIINLQIQSLVSLILSGQ